MRWARRFGVLTAVGALSASMMTGAATAAPADQRIGCTGIKFNTGAVCATIDSTSNQSINSFGGTFFSASPVVRPQLRAELFDVAGNVAFVADMSWGNDRTAEEVKRVLNRSFAIGFSRVCTSLFEAGQIVDTACQPVPS